MWKMSLCEWVVKTNIKRKNIDKIWFWKWMKMNEWMNENKFECVWSSNVRMGENNNKYEIINLGHKWKKKIEFKK
jgi:hypothetical protein